MSNKIIQSFKIPNMSWRTKADLIIKIMSITILRRAKYWSSTRDHLIGIEGKQGQILRSFYYRKFFKTFGENIIIGPNVFFEAPNNISLGDGVKINRNVYINGAFEIVIGGHVLIGPGTIVHSANHVIPGRDKQIAQSGFVGSKTTVGDDVWIAGNVSVLAGVRIGKGAVIGAGSVVTKNIPNNTINVGVPTKIVGKRV